MSVGLEALRRLLSRSEVQRLLRGGAWSVLGGVGSRLLMLLLTMLLVQSLGPRDFARFAVVQSTVLTALVFAGYGAGLAATRYASLLRAKDPERLARVLGALRLAAVVIGVAVLLCVAGGSRFLAETALGDADIQPLILLASVAVLFGALDAFQTGALVGLEAMRASAISVLVGAGIGMPVTLVLASRFGEVGAVGGLVAGYALQAGVSGLLLRRECARRSIRVSAQGGWSELRELAAFTGPSTLSGLMVAPTLWVVQANLMRSAPDGLQVTVLAVAMQWFHAICFVPQAAGRVILPVLSDLRARGRNSAAIGILRTVLVAYAVIVVPVVSGIVLAATPLMGLYGETLAPHGAALAVVAIAAALAALCVPVGHAIVAEGRMWLSLSANLLWATVFLAGSIMALDTGAYGVGLALLAAYGLLFLVSMGIVRVSLRAR